MDKKTNIQMYTHENEWDYRSSIQRLSKEFDILHKQDFPIDKTIYLLTQIKLFSTAIIGYAIIRVPQKIEPEKRPSLATYAFRVQESTFVNHKGIFINDFMIAERQRRRGIGTEFFKILINTYYPDDDILLVADGDGKRFWPALGFAEIDSATKTMFLTKR